MLESQETAARRFSHELHDELGQSLTAIKANVTALDPATPPDPARLEDCRRLIDEAIQNVRELSHLLRPTILDDFGLDAGIRWLAERFGQRTGIEVDYKSSFARTPGRSNRDTPVSHRAGGADQRRAAFGSHPCNHRIGFASGIECIWQ